MNDQPRQPLLPVIIFIAMILIIASAVLILLTSQPAPVQITILPPPATATPAPSATPSPLTIYVTGAVAAPASTILLPAGSRVQDALLAVGGVTSAADLARINLAAILSDGDQVHVPALGEASSLPTPGRSALRVAVNTASAADLETLPGIGPALAASIIAHRDANGPFLTLDSLDAVPGIGPALLADLADLIVFD